MRVFLWFSVLQIQSAVLCGAPAGDGDTVARVRLLREEIARHDELYHRRAAPEISDAAYDALKRELEKLEAAHPHLAVPSASVGFDDRSGTLPTARHLVPMGSLNKAYGEDELRAFHRKVVERSGPGQVSFFVEPKVDGLAVSVVYANGRLDRAVTRGDGREGDDITENILRMEGVPRSLRATSEAAAGESPPELVELRGELFIDHEEFERINRARAAAGVEPFAHPRNLATGTVKSLDAEGGEDRRLSIVFFGWGEWRPRAWEPRTHGAFRDRLRDWGLPLLEVAWEAAGADGLLAAVREAERRRRELPYPVDGVVVKVDSTRMQRVLGSGGGNPRWAVAYKYPPARATTRLLDITWQIGRTGLLSPVAILEPVEVGGATVARASLHNQDVIARLDARPGDYVFVERSGEVVPGITGVDLSRRETDSVPFPPPRHCPSCATMLESTDGRGALRCPNRDCSARLCRRIEHFASDSCVNIRGLGPATIERLVRAGLLRSLSDLFRLSIELLVTHGGLSEPAAASVHRSIGEGRETELGRVICGLGMPGVGVVTARRVAEVFPDLTALTRAKAGDFAEYGPLAAAGIGAAARQAMVEYLSASGNLQELKELIAVGVGGQGRRADGTLAGRVFVFTGELESLTRAQAAAKVDAAGGQVVEDVRWKVDYVVAGARAGAKLKRARELGLRVLDEAEFLAIFAEPP